jgi:tripartite-type tricarboxylate transporter receptor subunit TctC
MSAFGGKADMPIALHSLLLMTDVDLVHVPYRTSYLTDLIGGQVQGAFSTVPLAIEYVKAAKLRALAVTSAARVAALPDVPTVGDFVPGYEANGWFGVIAPKSTPKAIIDKVNAEVDAAAADPETKAQLVGLGVTPKSMTRSEFASFIANDSERWAKVIRAANIRPE